MEGTRTVKTESPMAHPVSRRRFCNLILGGCAVTLSPGGLLVAATPAPPAFADGFRRSKPDEEDVSVQGLVAFLDQVQNDNFELHSFMLWRHGRVIAEGWWAPYRSDRIHMMHSLTKSVTACAVGLALADGRFGLHDKVISFFKDELPATISDNLAAMTVEDLLTMRTGHAAMTSGSVWRQISTSWVAEFFKIPVVYTPGTRYVYTSAATYMLSAIISKTTGMATRDYLEPRVFQPLGISGYQWPLGPNGISPGANGLSWRTGDSLKLGVLHVRDGAWNDKQILPREWVAAVQAQHVPGQYGYQWWLGPEGAYYANGLFGQFSFVFPRHDAVLAITAAIPPGRGFTKVIFKHFPAILSETALSAADPAEIAAFKTRAASLELLPPVRATSSPIAAKVSGKTFMADANEDEVQSLRLDFSADQCVFALKDNLGVHTVTAGLRERIEGDTTMPGAKLHHEYELDRMRVVAGGEWRDDNTFVMTWVFVESAFRDTVVCRFDGGNLTFERSVNVNSGPLARPVLHGRLAAGAG
jgi:CubicO group peptidase (beta-lactamase class C family)